MTSPRLLPKKWLFTIPVILLSLFALIQWVSPPKVTSSGAQNSVPNDKVIHLRFGHNLAEDTALHAAAQRFADQVKAKSHGRIEIEVFPAQLLGNDHQMVEMARQGELDLLLTPTAKLSVPVPSMQYADLPFFFPTREDLYQMLDGEPGRMLLQDLQAIGLVGVTFWENGFKHFTSNFALTQPEDFQGKRIRVMKSRMLRDQFAAFGAEALPIDFYKTRQALQDGVVDGQENPLAAIVSMGFHQVQSHLTLSHHGYLAYVLAISEKTFADLPRNLGLLLLDTAREITHWERAEVQQREKALLETITQAGVQVHQLTEHERQMFAAKTAHIVRQYEEVIGTDIISKTEALLLQKYGPPPEQQAQVVIGLNADLSSVGKGAGLAIKRGAMLAIDQLNKQGGIQGKPVRLLALDHRITSSLGEKNVEQLAQRADLVAIIGGKHSAVIASEVPVINRLKVPYLVPWAAAAQLTEHGYEDNYIFRVSANDRLASEFIAEQTLRIAKKPALLAENSIWGRNNLEQMETYLRTQGHPAVKAIIYNRGQASFYQELEDIQQAGADALILVANSKEGSLILQAMAAESQPLPIVSHWGLLGGHFYQNNQQAINHLDLRFFQTFSFRKHKSPLSDQLQQAYLDSYLKESVDDIDSPSAVAQTYDLVMLLAKAIELSGSTERSVIKQTLEQLPNYQGVVKYYAPAFTARRHDALNSKDFYMARFSEKGKIVPVIP
ncbi:DctP family TRAP transporter solute-binding subunit [Oceanospirillum beijerinckii]|uniref:DctP family TRAP transporter solute-binding subunit n=1 Tax=Oceanospirillum beijerinckii TaxID=64976 RepID=UPI0004210F21|nr:DctP family TRAP transporter solute-binding subunit [Oceanospirillum beijerinckii]